MVEANHRAPENRPPTTDERIFLEWLISSGSPNAAKYAPQIPRASVVSRCTCGCPTIDFAVDGKHEEGGAPRVVQAGHEQRSASKAGFATPQATPLSQLRIDDSITKILLFCPNGL